MRVFVTGASGWIGSAVLPELIGAGHQVLGLARSDASAATVAATGADVLRGDLKDPVVLRAGAAGCDGVIHLAFVHDFTDFEGAVRADALAVQALGAALENTGKPLVVTAGTPAVAGRVATERDTAEPGSMAAGREQNAALALTTADRGVRSAVLRLPRSVHGAGDRHGFVARLTATARERGVAGYVGDGSSRWPAVHVRDAAHLYRLALENAPAGSVLHAVGDEGVPTRDIATAIGGALNLPTASVPREDFGFLGPLLALDQPASAAATRELLGWEPVGPGLIEDIDQGRYLSP
ncbi:3-beta hydroxysteroid dehydrogenase [Streptomyces xiamenensis]|uniref:3-beta hydroxysteroid dehydrogenase n=1 Tax=Streptomyces xiamenensis TaxID=408015 RepID=A0A0F7FWV0_9ACTN|nr:SDR family oxidoreductase [Streptomyces xiamenensis]AKG44892.1 3-beta hydroxysteroid dehydrogenase [Streptomyces xiamenensis]